MPSQAISAQNSKVYINTGTSQSPTWVQIKGVVSFSGFDGTASDLDVTDLDSVAMEYRSGLQDMGKFGFELNIVRSDPGQMAIEAARISGAVKGMKLELPGDAGDAIFDVLVKSTPMSGGVNAALKGSVDTKITGAVTWA